MRGCLERSMSGTSRGEAPIPLPSTTDTQPTHNRHTTDTQPTQNRLTTDTKTRLFIRCARLLSFGTQTLAPEGGRPFHLVLALAAAPPRASRSHVARETKNAAACGPGVNVAQLRLGPDIPYSHLSFRSISPGTSLYIGNRIPAIREERLLVVLELHLGPILPVAARICTRAS
jgi:hypothetical protein